MTADEKRALWRQMRVPLLGFIALLGLLAINVALGAIVNFRGSWVVEACVTVCMVGVVLLLSMDVREASPLIRLFSGLGFFWVLIMFTMTLTDYLWR